MTDPTPKPSAATPADRRLAKKLANSEPVIGVYASPEWDELSEDGKEWLATFLATARKDVCSKQNDWDWMAAVDHELIVSCLGTVESYRSPREALHTLLSWTAQVALDPRVSQSARELQSFHAAEVERLRAENEALREVASNAREALLYFKLHNGWRMTANEYDLAANAMAKIDQLTATGDRHE